MSSPFTPWYTSNSLISAVQRKISMPIYQSTLTNQDILDFASEELLISQVPSIMLYHEEYFVWQTDVPLIPYQTKYEIPDRAIGMRLRDLFFRDMGNNLYEMTRVAPDDQAFFQRNSASSMTLQKYFLQGNYIVLTDYNTSGQPGTLVFQYFLRPNRLVPDDRAAYIQDFVQTVTIDNSQIFPGDTITVVTTNSAPFPWQPNMPSTAPTNTPIATITTIFTAVASSPGPLQFLIDVSSVATANNLAAAINASGIANASNGSPQTATVVIDYDVISTTFTPSNLNGTQIPTTQGIRFTTPVPTNIANGDLVDFLQTAAGHMMRGFDIEIPPNGVSGNIITFPFGAVPTTLIPGDYVALAGEAIIPQIPSDLHTGLAERTSARILSAIGDTQGLAAVNQKISEIENRQGTLLDQRVEGSLKKVIARHSLLKAGKIGWRKRL